MGRYLALTAAGPLILTLLIVSIGLTTPSQHGCLAPPTSFTTNHSGYGTEVFSTGANITYTCSFGFLLDGPGSRTCRGDGTWSGTDDVCSVDIASLALACIFGAMSILIAVTCYCWLINRSRAKRRRQKRRLTIQREAADQAGVNGPTGLNGPAGLDPELFEGASPTKDGSRADRSDSGHPTDNEMGGIDLNVFETEHELEEDQWE